ncbi:MAG: hypothetical protein GTN83_11585, partial [Acidobacteria bacterium]|nr:hypothetical protein [Acidobacteriota bacterium]
AVPFLAQSDEEPETVEQESAEEAAADKPYEERIVVTGTRKAGLVPTETLSPVDVLDSEAIAEQASFDLTDGISRIAPSFNTQ